MFSKKSFPSLVGILGLGFAVVFALIGVIRTPGSASTLEDQSSYLPLISKPDNTSTPTATPTHTPIPTQKPGENWLSYINQLRSL